MKYSRIIFPALALVALISVSSTANASAEEVVDLRQKMQQACADKDEGDVCDFTNDKGESINGQCKRSGSADAKLSCSATN